MNAELAGLQTTIEKELEYLKRDLEMHINLAKDTLNKPHTFLSEDEWRWYALGTNHQLKALESLRNTLQNRSIQIMIALNRAVE